jgi:hypothetical protein
LVKIGGQKILEKLLRILKNVIEESFINWRVLPRVKINTRISDTPCILPKEVNNDDDDIKIP